MAFVPPPLDSLEQDAPGGFVPPPLDSIETPGKFVPPPVSALEEDAANPLPRVSTQVADSLGLQGGRDILDNVTVRRALPADGGTSQSESDKAFLSALEAPKGPTWAPGTPGADWWTENVAGPASLMPTVAPEYLKLAAAGLLKFGGRGLSGLQGLMDNYGEVRNEDGTPRRQGPAMFDLVGKAGRALQEQAVEMRKWADETVVKAAPLGAGIAETVGSIAGFTAAAATDPLLATTLFSAGTGEELAQATQAAGRPPEEVAQAREVGSALGLAASHVPIARIGKLLEGWNVNPYVKEIAKGLTVVMDKPDTKKRLMASGIEAVKSGVMGAATGAGFRVGMNAAENRFAGADKNLLDGAGGDAAMFGLPMAFGGAAARWIAMGREVPFSEFVKAYANPAKATETVKPADAPAAAAPATGAGAAAEFSRMAGLSREIVPVERGIVPVQDMGNAAIPVGGGDPAYQGQNFVDLGGAAPVFQGGSNDLAGRTPLALLLPQDLKGGGNNGGQETQGGSQVLTSTLEPSAATPQAGPEIPTQSDLTGALTVEFPVDKLQLSADVPNFKEGANLDTGVVAGNELGGKYDRRGVAPIVAWQRMNGNVEVVSGRHRLDLARRTGEKTIPTQIFKEADGFTKQDALTLDAELNIRDGQGTVKDYANYFRNGQTSEGEAIAGGLLSRAKGRSGFAIGRGAADDLYAAYVAGRISEPKAAAIAAAAPGNAGLQRAGMLNADRLSAAEIPGFLAVLERTAGPQEKQAGLFGNDESAIANSIRISKEAAKKSAEIADQIAAVKGAAKRPEAAAKLGVDVKDPQGILRKIDELAALKDKYDHFTKHPEIMAELTGREKPVKEPGALIPEADMPFNLSGETDLTPELQRAADEKRAAAEAQAAQDKAQGDMFGGGMKRPDGNAESGFVDIEAALDAAEAVGRKIYKKGMDFVRWAREMMIRAGKWVMDHLHEIWRRITGQDILPWARERGAVGDLSSKGEPIHPVSVKLNGKWIPVELAHLDSIKPGAMPEMVRLARELTGKIPDLKRFSKARGMAYTREGNRAAAHIKLDPRIFIDPVGAAKTLAHEIGHIADSFDEATLNRGNVLGRLAVLRDFLGSTLPIDPAGGTDSLTPKERQQIRRDAESAVGGKPAKDSEDLPAWQAEVARVYFEKIQDEMDDRGLAYSGNKDYLPNVREELLALTEWWRPYLDAHPSDSYVKYRESSKELYADFISVLLNNPAELQQRAPTAWEMFFNHLDNKPDAKRALFEMWDWMNKPEHERLAERRAGVLGMFRSGAELMARKLEARKRAWTVEGFRDGLRTLLDTKYWPIIKRERAAAAAGNPAAQQHVIEWFFDSHPLMDNSVFTWLTGVQDRVRNPLMEAGLTEEDMGEFLFWDRIAREDHEIERQLGDEIVTQRVGRATIANPQGHTKETALEGLDHLEILLGPEKFAKLRELASGFHEEFFKIASVMHDEGMISDDAWKMVETNRDIYAAFVPLEYADFYVPAGIKHQMGTLKDIANPWISTILKGITAIRAIEINRAKRTVVNGLKEMFPDEIFPAQTRFDGKRQIAVEPREPDLALLKVAEAGKQVGYVVPADVAAMFEHADHALLSQVVGPLDALWRNVFYPIFITYNPVFQFIRNPLRDSRRTALNLPHGVAPHQAITMRVANAKAVKDFVHRGIISPEIAAALDARALSIPEGTWQASAGPEDQFLAMARRFGLAPAVAGISDRFGLLKPITALGERIRLAGQVRELLPKLGTYRILTEQLGWGKEEAAFYTRNHVGTPNYTKHGTMTRVANDIFPFTNVFLKGWQADLRLMRKGFTGRAGTGAKRKSAASWWLRWLLTSGSLRVLQAAGAVGLLGAGIKSLYDRVGDYYMSNYDVLPLGETDGGAFDGKKTTFAILPRDPTDRILGALTYQFTKAALQSAMGQKVDAAALAPKGVAFMTSDTPGINPAIKIAHGWLQYAQGQNPYDSFRAAPVLTPQQQAAGGWPALKTMLAWSVGQTGIQQFIQYNPDSKSTLEIGVGMLPGINGVVRVSDNGLREKLADSIQAEDKARATAALSMPDAVQSLRQEYNYLRSVGADKRTPLMESRYQALAQWTKAVYEPLVEAVQLRPDVGPTIRNSADRLSRPYVKPAK